jgi:hypothetical protein
MLFGLFGRNVACCTQKHRDTVAFSYEQQSGWNLDQAEVFREEAAIHFQVTICHVLMLTWINNRHFLAATI